ncbi:MAG: hypothetical protein HC822_03040 [Oscillochloris sp.]|nr:hypothetical protein [Oscillochloris sp.]
MFNALIYQAEANADRATRTALDRRDRRGCARAVNRAAARLRRSGIDINALGQALAGRRIDLENPAAAILRVATAYELLLIDSILTGRNSRCRSAPATPTTSTSAPYIRLSPIWAVNSNATTTISSISA